MLLGFVLGTVVAGGAGLLYFKWKRPAASTAHPASVASKRVPASAPKSGRVDEVRTPPFGMSEDVFEAGAHVYKARCAGCHGTPGHDAAAARSLHPAPAQLWRKRGDVQPPGAIYAKVADGVPGMAGYRRMLSETAMWQVSWLLANAGKPLPELVVGILTAP